MIYDLLKDGLSIELLVNLCARLFVMFCVLPIHEYAHALVAYKLGDQTARLSGRLTINPLAHIDPFGALLILIAGFGYAKPVPVNPRNFKNQKGGMALTALAGPLSNLIMAFIFMVGYCAVFKFLHPVSGTFPAALMLFLSYCSQINISLAVFNLIPVPPLDGSRIIRLVIPDRTYYKIAQYERYLVYGVLLLVLIGVLDTPIAIASNFFTNLFLKVAAGMFGMTV
ncbi:MAG: site-2 protease family protein [Ruminococcus sp.]|nr:site-2 protease family protein [Ruminococcus sp.]